MAYTVKSFKFNLDMGILGSACIYLTGCLQLAGCHIRITCFVLEQISKLNFTVERQSGFSRLKYVFGKCIITLKMYSSNNGYIPAGVKLLVL